MGKNNKRQDNKTANERESSPRRYRGIIITFFLDIAFAVFAYWLARTVLFYSENVTMPDLYNRYELAVAAVVILIMVSMLVFFDCYNAVWRYAGRVEFFKFLLAYITSFIVLMLLKLVLNFAFRIDVWSTLIILYLLFSALLSGAARFFHAILHYANHLRNSLNGKSAAEMKRTIVIGAGYTGSLLINRFINNPHEGYYPVAVIDDDPDKCGLKIYGVRVEGGMEHLKEICDKFKADVIVIAIMSLTKSQLKQIYDKCKGLGLPIKIMPPMTNASDLSEKTLSLRDIKIEELLGRDEFKVNTELMDAAVKDKVVCVTGGAGSIGSELCRQALNFGCKHLVIFDVHENSMFELNEEFKRKYDTSRYTLVIGTVRERDKLDAALREYKPEILFHAAAYKHVPMMEISPTECIKNNVFGTKNVIEAAEAAGVKKFVLISTDKAVNPANVMGASKRIAEMLIQTRGRASSMQMAAVRFGNVLGSNGSVIPTFLKQIKEGGPITLTHRYIKRYFMTIPEAVRLVMQAGALASSGEVFVLDMGEPVYIYDLACDLIRINGLVPEQDIPIVVTGLREGEKLFEELRYDKEQVDATLHEGIFVTRLENIDINKFNADLAELREAAFGEEADRTVSDIFAIVPNEYRKIAEVERKESILAAMAQNKEGGDGSVSLIERV